MTSLREDCDQYQAAIDAVKAFLGAETIEASESEPVGSQ